MKQQILKDLEVVRKSSRTLINASVEDINACLLDLADQLLESSEEILEANKKDLSRMDIKDPKYDRLLLNYERLEGIASDIRGVVEINSSLGRVLDQKENNGLNIKKISVPLGVIGIIYEARPNVTFDVFSLCLKSGNACVLKGGSDAKDSNKAIVEVIKKVIREHGFDENIIYLAPAEREAVSIILEASEYIDIIIPRGSQNLINFVRENSKVPTIETGAGICHTYVEKSGNIEMAARIIFNAKTRRPSVCNTLDNLLLDKSIVSKLPDLVKKMSEKEVEIYADKDSFNVLKGVYPDNLLHQATEEDFGKEWLSLKMSVAVVDGYKNAIEWITKYSSKHSESIVTESEEIKEYFLKNVDAACVYANTSTAFTDGAQFGLGAEIGISTQKLHARGPMALEELTSYKWIVESKGLTRG